ncbi:glycoside hydrolase family 13 protein [Suillus fuscotomentosus]|uniref:Glycoside hydrolase family 13 protein n=1 Tax=Suillus fuscotomentosus TaxID=1912939 RepID=A0AAD4DVC8_9AGAM|nr:glycoside hydrolase family 13 protein [Suillus fuscotomentosus]KAG1894741.1 glycoside hydrolase family 13 protein [Suillus fuscotomentosus]
MSKPPHPWWKSATVYQIYPASFLDANGDGTGDLAGIIAKLDYLKDLGVDVIWLSPIYRSPLADMGYDISDYEDIDSRYGTLEDWDRLLEGAHARGMKLIVNLGLFDRMDLVHAWFTASKSSKNDPKRDWYIWRPGKVVDGEELPPNNWKSVFQGSAWERDSATGEYYLHLFVSKQPDLNWDNPVVRSAVWDVMRFWVRRGCDGFRMDVINCISKTDGLPDAPLVDHTQYYQPASMYYANGPQVHKYMKQMHTEVLSSHDLITVGETPFTHESSELAAYVLPQNRELNMVFQFELMDIDSPSESPLLRKPWTLRELKAIVGRWQRFMHGDGFWNAIYIENHDQARSVSRFGNDSAQWRAVSAKILAIFEVTQAGTLYVYQGQELGIKNFPQTWGIEEYKDVASQNYWNLAKDTIGLKSRQKAQGKEDVEMSDLLNSFAQKARDHARTPMQLKWNASPHAGFTTGTPWMRVNDDYREWNAEQQIGDGTSVHAFWRRALKVQKTHDVLIYGDFVMLLEAHEQVFAYTRNYGSTSALVLLNFKEGKVEIDLGEVVGVAGYTFVLGNYENEAIGLEEKVTLREYEGRVYVREALLD